MGEKAEFGAYWERRQDLIYYQLVRQLAAELGRNAQSIVDIGSNNCPYLDWMGHVPFRVSVDIERPYRSAGVTGITADFLEWVPESRFDLATCLQVLEHVPRPDLFARKLLETADTVIVSVPYNWPSRGRFGHLHDPINERDMRAWFGREPNFSYVCREVLTHSDRLIQVYEQSPLIWSNLSRRRQDLSNGRALGTSPPSRGAWLSSRLRKSLRSLRRQWLRRRKGTPASANAVLWAIVLIAT